MSNSPIAVSSARAPRQRLTATTLGIGLALATGSAAAQSASQAAPAGATELPAISVEGTLDGGYQTGHSASPKLPAPLLDTPQAITVIPRAVIEDQKATTLRDVLRNSPGITFGAGEGGGGQGEQLRIRGFAANTDLFLDGMRDAGVLNNRDPFNLEQVEVVKGAAGTYGGRGGTGGLINQVTKTPRLDPFAEASVSLGTDQTKRATADLNQPLTGLGIAGAAVRLNAVVHDGEVAGRDEVENSRWGFAPSLALGLGTRTRFTLDYLHMKHDNVPDYGLPVLSGTIPPVDTANWYGLKSLNTEEQTVDVGTAKLEHDLTDWLTLRDQFRYGVSTRFNIVTIPRFPSGTTSFTPATTVTRQLNGRDTENTVLINQTDAVFDFTTGFARHNLVAGVEVSRESYHQKSLTFAGSAPAANLFDPDPDQAAPGYTVNPVATDIDSDTLAFYVTDSIELGKQWELVGGVRWDRFDAESDSSSGHYSRTDHLLSWRGGVVYKPVPNASIYVAAGTAYNPSAESMQSAINDARASTEPEKNVTYEIGGKWEVLKEQLSLSAAIFRIDKTNMREALRTGEVLTLDGKRRVQGLELSASGRLAEGWQVIGGYTYMDSQILNSQQYPSSNEMANTPKHAASLWTTYEVPAGLGVDGLKIGGGVQYVGERWFNDANSGTMPSYVLFDAMVAYQVTDRVEVQLNGYNLTDKEYFDRAHGGGAHVIPGAGRTVLLSTNVRF